MERSHSIRSAITVAGIVGYARSNSRIRGSAASTIDPLAGRSYFGGRSLAIAARTVFLDTFITRAIALIGIPSARCSLRISAQSSTESTPFTPWLGWSQGLRARGQNSDATPGSVFTCRGVRREALLIRVEVRDLRRL